MDFPSPSTVNPHQIEDRLSDWTEGLVVRELHNCCFVYTELSGNKDVLLLSAIKVGSENAGLGSRIRCRLINLFESRKLDGAKQRVRDYQVLPMHPEWTVNSENGVALFNCPVVFNGFCHVKGREVAKFYNEKLLDILDINDVLGVDGNSKFSNETIFVTIKRRKVISENMNVWDIVDVDGGVKRNKATMTLVPSSSLPWINGVISGMTTAVIFISTNQGEAVFQIPNHFKDEHLTTGRIVECKVRSRCVQDGHTDSPTSLVVTDYRLLPFPSDWELLSNEDHRLVILCPARYNYMDSQWIVLQNSIISEMFDMDDIVMGYCLKNNIDRENVSFRRIFIQRVRLRGRGVHGWAIKGIEEDEGESVRKEEMQRSDGEMESFHGIVCNSVKNLLFVSTEMGDAVLRENRTEGDVSMGTHIKCRLKSRLVFEPGQAQYTVTDYYVPIQPEGWALDRVENNTVVLSCPAYFSHIYQDSIVLCNEHVVEIYDMGGVVERYCTQHSIDYREASFSRIVIKRTRLKNRNGIGGWVVLKVEEEERDSVRRREGGNRTDAEVERRRESIKEERRGFDRNDERERRRESTEMDGKVERDQSRSSSAVEYDSTPSPFPSTNQSIDGFVIKKWGVYFVVWTPNGLALIFDDLSVKGKKAELGSFIQCKLGDLPSPILDRRLTYTQKVIDYSVEEIQRYGRGIVRGEHAVISCRIHFLEFRRRLLPVSSSESGLPSRNAIFKHPFLGEIVDEKMLIQNPAPGDSYQVIVKGVPINEFTIGWIVEREEGEEKERKERVKEERGGKERGMTCDYGSQSVAETTDIPSETASSLKGSQCFELLVRRVFSLQTVRDILKRDDEQLFSEIIDQLLD